MGGSMSAWTPDELSRIARATELEIASRRADGSLRGFVTIWVVQADDQIFVRSAYGNDNPWFQRAIRSGAGRIRAGGVERDVTFEEPGHEFADAVTAAYHAKYDGYGRSIVDTVVSPEAVRSTLLVRPA